MSGPNKNLVLGYAKAVHLRQVALKVSIKSRDKVVLKKSRSVHAFAEGYFVGVASQLPAEFSVHDARSVTYQPFIRGYFFNRDEPEVPVDKVDECCMFGASCAVPPGANIIAKTQDISPIEMNLVSVKKTVSCTYRLNKVA
jgi:hypothetical protein